MARGDGFPLSREVHRRVWPECYNEAGDYVGPGYLGPHYKEGNSMSLDHEPLPVKGYINQNSENILRVNINKEIEEHLLRRLETLQSYTDCDLRWLAVAKTQFEIGFMAMNRAVFKPERVKLPEDAAN